MRVIFREAAYADLDRIYSWITRDNPGAAARVVERILDSTELLRRHPHIAMPVVHTAHMNGWCGERHILSFTQLRQTMIC